MSTWELREEGGVHPPEHLSGKLEITPRFLELLWHRGLRNAQDIEAYLSPSLSRLTHPDLWPSIPTAASLIVKDLLEGKTLAVWGDYDVDGITATTLVLDILEFHGFHPLHHLPNRRREGYGLNVAGIEKLADQGCETLLTVDCGISDQKAIERANELGIKVIVSDHHLPPASLPKAAGIVNPRLDIAGSWPCAHLAGVGVAFFLMAEVNILLEKHTGLRFRMDDVLDLVALGTLADIMNIKGENRILVHAGLKQMRQPLRPGLLALKSVSGIDSSASLSTEQAIFQLAPRINAAGRMGDPGLGLQLLRASDLKTAIKLADELNVCNQERKTLQEQMFKEACAQAEDLLGKEDVSALVLYGAAWHPGIVGIIAAKIVEEYKRPAFALCDDADALKGSGRGLEGLDIYAALSECAPSLLSFGGHKMAAGVRLDPAFLEQFRTSFSKAIEGQKKGHPFEDKLYLDGMLNFTQACDNDFLAELKLMEPFGPGNPEPVFLSPELLVKNRRFLGHRLDSVILELEDRSASTPKSMYAKIWRRAHEFPQDLVNKIIRIAYTPRKTDYNGLPSYEVLIRDWRMIKPALSG